MHSSGVRTCPACGKDTRAETTEPCTRCGFSPAGESGSVSAETVGTLERGGVSGDYELPAPSEPAPSGSPSPTPSPTRRSGIGPGAIWIVIILIGIASQAADGFEGCADAFEQKPGPTAQEAEDALLADAQEIGLSGVTVDCPDSAEDTEAGASFECTVTDPGTGATVPIEVTNREDSFEWSRRPFAELLRERAGP